MAMVRTGKCSRRRSHAWHAARPYHRERKAHHKPCWRPPVISELHITGHGGSALGDRQSEAAFRRRLPTIGRRGAFQFGFGGRRNHSGGAVPVSPRPLCKVMIEEGREMRRLAI